MYLDPIFYENSEILSAVDFKNGRWESDNNPSRIINGPLSGPGEELETPIQQEYDQFIEDCLFVIATTGFIKIQESINTESEKSKYVLMFGLKDKPYGKLVFDLRISDHLLDRYTFPEEFKETALEYLKLNKILDESATKAGINFKVAKVLVGSVKNDTWDKALNRLFQVLKHLRSKVQQQSEINP